MYSKLSLTFSWLRSLFNWTIYSKVTNFHDRVIQISDFRSTLFHRYPSNPLSRNDHGSYLFVCSFQEFPIIPRNTRWWHILTIPISFPISICIISDFHVEFGFPVEPVIFSTTTFITTSRISSNSMESCSSSTVTIGFKPIYFYAPFVTIFITITVKIISITAWIKPLRRNRVNVSIYSGFGTRKINVIFYPSIK